jgi:RHS repeat-associated protein
MSPSAASAYDNVVLYCGYRWDGETGLYHVRHRMYHATLGRWLQRDPAGYSDSASFYQYVVSAPVNARDPSGLRVVGSVECPGGEWYVTGTKTGGHLAAIGYSSTIVTLTCKQRKHVATEEWCHEGHTIARRKVWEVPTVKGRMHSLTAGPGIGTQRSKVFGEISGAESSRDFGKYSGSVGAQGTLGVVGGEVSAGSGSYTAGGGWAAGLGVSAGATGTRFNIYSVSTETVKERLGIGEYAATRSGPAERCWVAVANPKWEPNTDPPVAELF